MKTVYSEDVKKEPVFNNGKFFEFNKKLLITRGDGIPYLIRHTLITFGKFFSVKIHDIVQSDDACLHDHPWSFLSIVLKGGYYEWTHAKNAQHYTPADYEHDQGVNFYMAGNGLNRLAIAPDGKLLVRKWYGPGSILWRPNPWPHRLELAKEKTGHQEYDFWFAQPVPCKTLVFTFKVNRKWGFFTKGGWMYWRYYNKKQHC